MSVVLVTSTRFDEHLPPPGHPERPGRAEVMEVIAGKWAERGARLVDARPATRDELLRVHDAGYVEAIEATSGLAVALDRDTYTSSRSAEVAALAAGASLAAVEEAIDGPSPLRAAALVRPPGHHAERARARGFCIYNNAGVAAAHALALGARRVAIVDYDVHHGNGTQAMFYDDPRVLFVSVHQFPLFPGTGSAADAGCGAGEGFTLNVPLEAGATDGDYDLVFSMVVVPVLREFAPDLLIVSAGFDAHMRDPLGSMRLSTAGYAAMMGGLLSAIDQTTGRLVLITEGGYHLKAFAACLDRTLAVMAGEGVAAAGEVRPDAPDPVFDGDPEVTWQPTARGTSTVNLVRAVQSRYWRGL
jgi:acetoin utilization deacetylase AcuC-like enzyme